MIELISTWRPRHHSRVFADDTEKIIFLYENYCIPIQISLKFAPNGSIENYIGSVQMSEIFAQFPDAYMRDSAYVS